MVITGVETVKVQGISGLLYEFSVYPWGTSLQTVGGVYLILKRLPNGNYQILYVGQTSDLSERFDNHHKQNCFNRNGKSHIGARREDSEQNRLRIESELISKYIPTCNSQN